MIKLPPPESIAIHQRCAELRATGIDVIDLSIGQANVELPDFSFSELDLKRASRYSDSRGIGELRHKIAGEYSCKPDPDHQIIVSAGSKLLVYMVLQALCDRGSEVLVEEPAWLSYRALSSLCGARLVSLPYGASEAELSASISSDTRLVIVNNPNNPSGKLYTKEELIARIEIAKEEGIILLCDEAYSASHPSFVSVAELDPHFSNSLIVNSFSKNFALPGWRLGYAVGNRQLISQIGILNQHLMTCASTLSQMYVAHYYDDLKRSVQPQLNELQGKRGQCLRKASELGLSCMPGISTFYLMIAIPESVSSEEFAKRLLEEKHVAVVPGCAYGQSVDGFVRVSIGMETSQRVELGLGRIKSLLTDISGPNIS